MSNDFPQPLLPPALPKPYKFMGFGAMDITNPYNSIGFGAMDATKPYDFIGFGVDGGEGFAENSNDNSSP